MATEQKGRNIVIIGGGIIGCTTAYFLSHHPRFNPQSDTITLLEATKIAGGASGKAGGLLGLWAYPSCIVPLSYRLHQELAERHNGAERWGYRAIHCGQIDAVAMLAEKSGDGGSSNSKGRKGSKESGDSVSLQKRTQSAIGLLRAAGVPKDLDWIAAESLKSYEEMGTPLTTAQVHPYHFTTSMADLAQEKGVKIVYGSATNIEQENGSVRSVSYRPKDESTTSTGNSNKTHSLPADTVILTAGPWTRTLHPSAPISALRAHSITIRPSRPVSAYALFTSIALPPHKHKRNLDSMKSHPFTQTATPEIYARPNNEVYACGEGDTLIPLPTSSDLVACDEARCREIYDQVASISEELRNGEVMARQACYLPNVEGRGGGPLVGETSVKGLLMGAGHTCWGIQNGPGTGKLLAELAWEGKMKSAQVGSLDPRKFGV
ncbi:hypothetical protein IAQ61_008237 [Plenodomus lingam]|uniref:Similar to FAD dependent oxidoreductase n=1 Tax=Leptosphaeria maculans (strain JN3 / isolate v23.1.3 / race Av1-4-5-6-7-8) TaxID=985895 RepID=E4ZZV3_LEPMJ|nr:similar to FAD dependent oxidoreductase [Plenodomus lingam JN3]KAH9867643.1 hypothetical protein IAQ61_008237 [Plenodomus lingam]CBX96813.1 similar to FAD dependent oxidoreductase [Plenodomus lingam JN3]